MNNEVTGGVKDLRLIILCHTHGRFVTVRKSKEKIVLYICTRYKI